MAILTCKACGTLQSPGTKICVHCKTPLPEVKKSKAVQPVKSKNRISVKSTCSNCGTAYPAKIGKCPNCGSSVKMGKRRKNYILKGGLIIAGIGISLSMIFEEDISPATSITSNAPASATVAAEAQPEPELSDEDCKKDTACWGKRHLTSAQTPCQRAIERQARYDFEWTDGWLGTRFMYASYEEDTAHIIVYSGDSLRLQNGFGAWSNYSYACEFDTRTKQVLDVVVYQ